jgi:hypothetical protein
MSMICSQIISCKSVLSSIGYLLMLELKGNTEFTASCAPNVGTSGDGV